MNGLRHMQTSKNRYVLVGIALGRVTVCNSGQWHAVRTLQRVLEIFLLFFTVILLGDHPYHHHIPWMPMRKMEIQLRTVAIF
jgi:sulfite exporter TauE/SafE